MLSKIGIVVIYLLCGFVSAWLFYTQSNFYIPGLIFIAVTVVMALVSNSTFNLKSIALYCVFSYTVYLAVFYLTINSGTAGVITGIFLCGAGAQIVFWLTNKFLVEVNFKSGTLFWLGALSFLANVLLFVEPVSEFIKPVYDIDQVNRDGNIFDINIRFAPSYLFWQLSVGTKLGYEIFKNRAKRASSLNE